MHASSADFSELNQNIISFIEYRRKRLADPTAMARHLVRVRSAQGLPS